MKSRIGFVSNSSSSSFIVAGIPVNGREERGRLEALEIPGLEYYATEYSDGEGVFGVWVTSVDHGEIQELDPEELINGCDVFLKAFSERGIPIPEGKTVNAYLAGE